MILFDEVPIPEYFTKLFNYNVEFEADNPKFRCCFGKAHVVNASKVLLLVEIFVVIPLYVFFMFPWWFIWIGMHLPLILITMYALRQEKHRFMWPIVIFAALQFIVWALVTVFQLIVAVFNTDAYLRFYAQNHHEDFFSRMFAIIIIKAIVLVLAAFLFWRLSVFYATKNYFSARCDGEVELNEPKRAEGVEKLLQPI